MSESGVFQLKCSPNNYPWGKRGSESLAARYAASTPNADFKIDETKEYAEMWMGTYPTLPSYLLETGENLQDVLDKNPDKLIGKKVIDRYGTKLPYLPKILSIAKALPLQVHPDKDIARRLHSENPDKYPDDNHKPEIAIALSDFEVFVGFRPLDEIRRIFTAIPAVASCIEIQEGELTPADLKRITHALLTLPEEKVASLMESIKTTPKSALSASTSYIPGLAPRLISQFEQTDPGSLVALLTMNFLTLSPGEALSIPADGIHAYLSGDIVECMARSNNVINTGFCPKADRDDPTLFVDSLTFSPHAREECLLKKESADNEGLGKNGKSFIWDPPMSEFSVVGTGIEGKGSEQCRAIEGPSVLVVTGGQGTMKAGGKDWALKEGWVFFVGCGVPVEYETSTGLQAYRMFCE